MHGAWRDRTAAPSRWAFPAALTAVVVLGVLRAYALRWVGDDIFITLRYVDNFLEGHGFVYNTGERVEGYTHFTWLLLLALARKMGFDAVGATMVLGIAAYAGVLALCVAISRSTLRRSPPVFFPLTTVILAVHYDFQVWATGGLETMLLTWLWVAAFAIVFATSWRLATRLALSGSVLLVAALTRPDAVVILALANVLLLGWCALQGRGLRASLAYLAALDGAAIAVLPSYFVWKVTYYGDILPNTYYAKLAYDSYYSQGFFYLWTYLRAYPTSLAFVLGTWALRRRWQEGAGHVPWRTLTRDGGAVLVAMLGVIAYTVLFVVRVGGDFMYARFLVPVLPFVFLVVEAALLSLAGARARALAFVGLAAAVGLGERALRDDLLLAQRDGAPNPVSVRGIVDERLYYRHVLPLDRERDAGRSLQPWFAGLDATVLLRGQACLGYYADFRRCIDAAGLTDRTLARLPVATRTRVGHERSAPHAFLVDQGVDFVFQRPPYLDRDYRRVAFRVAGDRALPAELITYDRRLIAALAERCGPDWRYTDFEAYLDRYIAAELGAKTPASLRADYDEFAAFYFRHNDDRARERPFLEQLEALESP